MGQKNIFIVAGELSGDLHSAKLMREILALVPDINFIGVGGSRMQEYGLKSLVSLDEISIVGFSKIFSKGLQLRSLYKKCENIFINTYISLLILVDFPGFNLRLASLAKKYGIPVCYYIAPQVWAWGKTRIKEIKSNVDLLIVAFPFEVEIFEKEEINVKFFGHPLLDEPIFTSNFSSLNEREQLLAILPGSRPLELSFHLKIVSDIVKLFSQFHPEFRIGISIPNIAKNQKVLNSLKGCPNVQFWNNPYDLMKKSRLGLIKSGTSNLESALLGLPFVMFYKTSALSYLIGKSLVNTEYLSIVNVLMGKKVVTECIQKEATPMKIYNELERLIANDELSVEMQNHFYEIRKMLGDSGCAKNSAKEIISFFGI